MQVLLNCGQDASNALEILSSTEHLVIRDGQALVVDSRGLEILNEVLLYSMSTEQFAL